MSSCVCWFPELLGHNLHGLCGEDERPFGDFGGQSYREHPSAPQWWTPDPLQPGRRGQTSAPATPECIHPGDQWDRGQFLWTTGHPQWTHSVLRPDDRTQDLISLEESESTDGRLPWTHVPHVPFQVLPCLCASAPFVHHRSGQFAHSFRHRGPLIGQARLL